MLPLPFNPKKDQIFHLVLCSNYEAGVRTTKNFYCEITGNPKYSPDNKTAYERFKKLHPKTLNGLNRRKKPLQWKILWKIIRQHEGGICDCKCRDFERIEPNYEKCQLLLDWLEEKGYLISFDIKNAWESSPKQYKLNWIVVKMNLGIDPPSALIPPSSLKI